MALVVARGELGDHAALHAGRPHGSRSSLFVSQDTALAMKKIYIAMAESGMFGPMKMG